ncbi:uncharacterized protein LOC113505893 isoform X2 [Trichoplusia ni]|nr:uncharacterized protein LOC113491814 isoform X2 [Trichoplusia ni]XP_026744557.1 uncharacterized protein LOC113505893 isoform X2 [Trichoplusia ni]
MQAKQRNRRSYTTKHSQHMIDLAVDALQNKTMSSYDAEKIFGIPRRTLLDKLHNKHPKSPGCPTRLNDQEEANIIKVLLAAAEFGSPLTLLDLRIVVHRYLEGNGRLTIFDNKLPGKKWAYSFIKRHKSKLAYRVVQNIKRSRAEKSPDEMKEYFTNLQLSLKGVPSDNILNYDETNLTDDPGSQKCLFKRGVKYPERVLNSTKGAISIMFAITAGGECLPPYVVYKAEHLYTTWTLNGPKGSRYNRSKSGWFDSVLFEDWFESIILPWAKNKTGTKVLIGDNLASHINPKIVSYCEGNNIRFVFLPPNSSHLTQPLDVCYFGPLKKLWREILLNYKIKNPRQTTVHKGHFPDLLKKLVVQLNEKTNNIISAFKSTGIAPFNPDKVILKIPDTNKTTMTYTVDEALLDWLKETRKADPNKKVRNKKLNVPPGKSVCTTDFENLNILPKKVGTYKIQRKTNSNTMQLNPDLLLQPPLMLINPDSLKTLCLRSVNNHLVQLEQYQYPGEQTLQVSDVHNLCDISKNYNANMRFINEIPNCLQTNKPKIIITSDITIKPGEFTKHQQIKQGNINIKQKKCKITRSAIHMKLIPARKETLTKRRKVFEDITEEIKALHTQVISKVSKKPKEENMKRRLIKKETNKAKQKKQKCKSMKQKKKYNSSESSFTSDTEISYADTEDSEYETMDDIITSQQEEENIEPSIPYGISDIKYLTEDDKKLENDSWILAKFTTKKSMKHFVGKVISIKDNIPEVKFVRKKKESKFDGGLVFSYPRVDDICTMQHLDDVIMKLPEPNISRRGEIIFNIDLSNYNVQ